jgi:hypothetical protein
MTRSRDVADTQENLGGAVPPFVAGKNKVINGDFGVWQRGTSFSNPASDTGFTSDRFYSVWNGTGATATISQQTFTPGTAPVTGYEGTYFLRYNVSAVGTGNVYRYITTSIEDVRTFAGQTVTFSFWAKASTNTSIQNMQIDQNFGSGGSAINYNAFNNGAITSFSLTTSWQRFTVTGQMVSVAGKTIGTGSYLRVFLALPANATFTIDTWGWQLESGSVATPFTTASGSIGGELALCQRYYYVVAQGATDLTICNGYAIATTQCEGVVSYPQMRTAPALVASTGTSYYKFRKSGGDYPVNSLSFALATPTSGLLFNSTQFSGTAGVGGSIVTNNSGASIALSAEL